MCFLHFTSFTLLQPGLLLNRASSFLNSAGLIFQKTSNIISNIINTVIPPRKKNKTAEEHGWDAEPFNWGAGEITACKNCKIVFFLNSLRSELTKGTDRTRKMVQEGDWECQEHIWTYINNWTFQVPLCACGVRFYWKITNFSMWLTRITTRKRN